MPKRKLPQKSSIIHPFAIVETRDIGPGTRVWAWSHIQRDVVIGEKCNIGEHCFIEEGVRIGNQTVIKNGVCIWKGVLIGDGVFIGPGAVFTNEVFPRSGFRKEFLTTRLEKGASVGAGAVIMAGITIGGYAMVGAGSVVTKDVAPHTLVYGNPAKKKGYVCICGFKVVFKSKKATCGCGRRFVVESGQVKAYPH
jgi:acetyltransferase-like isoleucine patch superfamily enzyme